MTSKYGKNLFEKETVEEVLNRIDTLTPETKAQWGKMNSGQMLAHCAATFDAANGQRILKRSLLGYTLGPLLKHIYTNEKPLPKNSPTDKSFIMGEKKDFGAEKERLKKKIEEFYSGGPEKVTKHAHTFFGKLTPEQWTRGMYKHLDHHLRQFGV